MADDATNFQMVPDACAKRHQPLSRRNEAILSVHAIFLYDFCSGSLIILPNSKFFSLGTQTSMPDEDVNVISAK